MNAVYFKSVFMLLATMIISTFAFALEKEYLAEILYSIGQTENPTIAKERAFIEAKRKIITEAMPYIDMLLKDKKIDLTKDQLQVVASFFTEFEVIKEKASVTKAGTMYSIKLRMVVWPEKIIETAIKATGKLIADDYRDLLEQIEKNQSQLNKLKRQFKSASSKKQTVNRIQEAERLFQGLIFYDKGFGYFLRARDDLAIIEFSKSIELNPSYVKAYSYRAKLYQLQGNIEAAIQDYKHVIDINPSHENAHYNLGTIFVEKAEDDLAITHLTKAILLNPNFAEAYNNRGTAYSHKKQYDLAIDDFTKSISLNSNDPTTYHNRGFVFFKKGAYEAAIKDATKAIEMNPDYVEAYFVRGLSYIELLDDDRGMSDVKKACEMNYSDACEFIKQYPQEKINYARAWAFYNGGEINKALDTLKHINKPDDERTILLTSLIYLKQEKPEDALNLINKVRNKIEKAYARIDGQGPDDQTLTQEEKKDIRDYYHYMLFVSGSANYQLDDCKRAIEDLEIFVLNCENVMASDILGVCHAILKEYEKAIKYFTQGFNILEKQPTRNIAAYNIEAYNIASANALNRNVEQAILWAKIPLDYDRKMWLEKIRSDKDFDRIRNEKKFKMFIEEQEKMLSK